MWLITTTSTATTAATATTTITATATGTIELIPVTRSSAGCPRPGYVYVAAWLWVVRSQCSRRCCLIFAYLLSCSSKKRMPLLLLQQPNLIILLTRPPKMASSLKTLPCCRFASMSKAEHVLNVASGMCHVDCGMQQHREAAVCTHTINHMRDICVD